MLVYQHAIKFIPKASDCDAQGSVDVGLVAEDTGGLVVLLAELTDGIGTFQGVDGLIVVGQEGGVEMGEVIIDVLRHLLVLFIYTQRVALQQAVAEFGEVGLHAMDRHAIRHVSHSQCSSHFAVGQGLLLVQHCEQ